MIIFNDFLIFEFLLNKTTLLCDLFCPFTYHCFSYSFAAGAVYISLILVSLLDFILARFVFSIVSGIYSGSV